MSKRSKLIWLCILGFKTASALEDPIAQCEKQPAEKMMMLVDKFGVGCPALAYFKQSMKRGEAYMIWCTRVIDGMNRLQREKSSLPEELFEKRRSPLVQQRMHLNSLVNSIAGEVDRICTDETGAK